MSTGLLHLYEPPLAVRWRRSAAANRATLSVSRLDGGVVLTTPPRVSERAARQFLNQHQGWLTQTLARLPSAIAVLPGIELPFQGQACLVAHDPTQRGVTYQPGHIIVGGPAGAAGARLAVWLREQARAQLLRRAWHHATTLGRPVSGITIRDTRSRWGSCASTGKLSFSWRLILAPPAVLDYVAAHEVAHLVEMNHGPRFWAVVERLCPGWQTQREWLKHKGASLHRYRLMC